MRKRELRLQFLIKRLLLGQKRVEKLTISICGASGFIGSAISNQFAQNCRVISLPRNFQELPECDVIINLAGAPIYQYWTKAALAEIKNSRISTTERLATLAKKLKKPPACFISASAIGYYGDRGEEALNEESAPGKGALPLICKEWEDASIPFEEMGARRVLTRFGIVIGQGGILQKLLPLARLHLAGRLGSGNQWLSWIALEDLVQVISKAIYDADLKGQIACVSPNPIRQKEFALEISQRALAGFQLAAPEWMIRLFLGQMGEELLLSSTKVIPTKLQKMGFRFSCPDFSSALHKALCSLK
jgi:uncharacterized protein